MLTDNDMSMFMTAYRTALKRALDAERNGDYDEASRANFEIASLIQALLTRLAQSNASGGRIVINNDTARKLEREALSRVLRAYSISAMKNIHFGDLAVSVASEKKIEEDLKSVAASARGAGGGKARDPGDDADIEDENDDSIDVRQSDGLYEIVSTDNAPMPEDLIGYSEQANTFITLCYTVVTPGGRSAGNARATKAILMYGPPGSGKTTTAQAVARKLGLVYVFGKASNLVSVYAGRTQKNLEKLYRRCRMIAKQTGRNVLLLIDELDGLIKNRTNNISGEEYNRITTFLQILEPNNETDNSMIVSAFTTNRISNIDAAVVQRCSTLFLGYISDPGQRTLLLKTMFGGLVDDSSFPWDTYGRRNAEMVPRDYTRMLSRVEDRRLEKVLRGRRIDEYARANNISSFRIELELPRVTSEEMRAILDTAEPATRYTSYFDLYDPPQTHIVDWLARNRDIAEIPSEMKEEFARRAKV